MPPWPSPPITTAGTEARRTFPSTRRARETGGTAVWFLPSSTPSAAMKREAPARMQMGVTYLEQRNLPSAMRELTRAAELDPDNSEIDMTLGLAYQARGGFGKAEEYLQSAIRKNPDNAAAHNNLGNIFSLQGKGDEAIREYEKAVSNVLYPTPEDGYYNTGREYAPRTGLPQAAAAD